MLDGTAAELSVGVYCWQDSAEDTYTQAVTGHQGRRNGPKWDKQA